MLRTTVTMNATDAKDLIEALKNELEKKPLTVSMTIIGENVYLSCSDNTHGFSPEKKQEQPLDMD